MKAKTTHRIKLTALTVALLGIAAAVFVLVGVLSFVAVYDRTMMADASTNAEQSARQTAAALENYLNTMEEKLVRIAAEITEDSLTDTEELDVAVRLYTDVEAVMIYSADGSLIVCSSNGQKVKDNIKDNLSFDSRVFSAGGERVILLPHVENLYENYYPWVVTLMKRMDPSVFGDDVCIAVDFSFSGIAQYIDNVGFGRHGYCYVIDADGKMVYHPQQQMFYAGIKDEDVESVAALPDGVHLFDDALRTVSTLEDGNWRIVGVSYTDDFAASRRQAIVQFVAAVLLCCVAIAVLTVLLYAHIVNRPVNRLVHAMRDFERFAETYSYTPQNEPIAELQTLSDSFGHMVCMVQSLMEQIKAEEISLRKTELKALQAQINPHFLYNTLDSIQWMCEQGKNEDAVKMIGALARLFRISISRGKEIIPIRDELRHAESYLLIQSYRYKDRFSYTFEVDENLKDCYCNKITIQPLIENAIYHGIEGMLDDGKITVRVHKDPAAADNPDADILIEVEDNGVGMTAAQCAAILSKERSDSSGIGIKNVNDRLKIFFGDKYGITIKSEPDVGTCVTVRLPQLGKEPEA